MRNVHRAAALVLLTFCLLLCVRAQAADISWVAPNGGSWQAPQNWSSNPALPSADDRVVFAVPISSTITYAGGDQQFKSLESEGAFFEFGGGNVVFQSNLSLLKSALAAVGPETHIAVEGSSAFAEAEVRAESGAVIQLNGLVRADNTSFVALDGGVVRGAGDFDLQVLSDRSQRFNSRGAGSLIDVGSLAEIELQGMMELTLRADAGGAVRLGDLQQVSATTKSATFLVADGGTIEVPALATLSGRARLRIENKGVLLANSLTSVREWAPIDIRNGSRVELTALSAWQGSANELVDGVSLTVDGGSELLIPSATSLRNAYLVVSGATSALDTRSVQTLEHVYVSAREGARLQFPALERFVPWSTRTDNDAPAEFLSSEGSFIDLSALKEVVGPGGFTATAAGGVIDLHNLAKIESSRVSLSAGNVTTNLDSLTSIATGRMELWVLGGGAVIAPHVTNLETTAASIWLEGAGSKLDLSGLAQVSAPPEAPFSIFAYSGSHVDLSGLQEAPAYLEITCEGGAKVDLSGLETHSSNLRVDAQGGQVFLDRLTEVDGGLFFFSEEGGQINLPALATVRGSSNIRLLDRAKVSLSSLPELRDAKVTLEDATLELHAIRAELVSTQVDIHPGATALNAGELVVDANSKIMGAGRINAAVVNHGWVGGPQFAVGELVVDGNYSQTDDAVFETFVPKKGQQGDKLTILGSATLGGRIQITLGGAFTAELGETFTVLTSETLTGSFQWGGVLFGEGQFLTPISVSNEVVLLSAIAGDANLDGRVDLNDFGLMKANFGAAGSLSQGNLNGDRIVDLNDFGVLKANFGRLGGPNSPVAVPEPTAMSLLTVGVALLLLGRRGLLQPFGTQLAADA